MIHRSLQSSILVTAAACSVLPAYAEKKEERKEQEEMEVIEVSASREVKWIDEAGTRLRVDSETLTQQGAQDLAGFAKYDPTVSLPFDFSSGDGAYGYAQSGYGSINIRGMEGNRIAVELDGVRQPPQYISTSFDQSDEGPGGIGRDYFDPAMFEMVEILKGGAGVLFGSDAMGGVVSFTTPSPAGLLKGRTRAGLVRAQYFSVNESFSLQASAALQSGNTSGLFLLSFREGSETINNGREKPNPADFDSLSALLKLEHVHKDHLFRATVETFERNTFIDAISAVESDFFPIYNNFVHNDQHLERQRVSFNWDYDAKALLLDRVESHFYWQHSESSTLSDMERLPTSAGVRLFREQTIDFLTDIVGFSTKGRKKVDFGASHSHTFTSGIQFSSEEAENKFERWSGGRGTVNIRTPEDKTAFAPNETLRGGIFLEDRIEWSGRWFLTLGARMDYHRVKPDPNQEYLDRLEDLNILPPETYENFSFSPQVDLAWKPVEWLQIYGNYSHGIRNPTGEELSMIFAHPATGTPGSSGNLTIPNPDLKEEISDAFEIGVKTEGKMGRFQGSVFYTLYDNFIENGVQTGERDSLNRDIVTSLNRGRVDIYGFELSGQVDLGYWTSQLEGWQAGLSTGKSVGIDRSEHQWLNTIEPWKTVGFIGYTDPDNRFGARVTAVYMDDVTRVNDETFSNGTFFRPSSWFTMDLSAFWSPTETLTIHAGVNNLFDEKYWEWGSVRRGGGHLGGNNVTDRTTAPGRSFYVSLTKTF